ALSARATIASKGASESESDPVTTTSRSWCPSHVSLAAAGPPRNLRPGVEGMPFPASTGPRRQLSTARQPLPLMRSRQKRRKGHSGPPEHSPQPSKAYGLEVIEKAAGTCPRLRGRCGSGQVQRLVRRRAYWEPG